MAKKKESGESIEVRFVKERDSLKKFQKILRKILKEEKRNIVVDMVYAPEIDKSYLSSLVFIAQSLKMLGRSFTIIISPENYQQLSSSEHARLFTLEIAQIISEEEISEMKEEEEEEEEEEDLPFVIITENIITVEDEGLDDLPVYLPRLIEKVIKSHQQVVVNLTKVFLLTPETIDTLVKETKIHGEKIKLLIQESMKEVIEANPKASCLNTEIMGEDSVDGVDEKINTEVRKTFSIDFESEDTPIHKSSDVLAPSPPPSSSSPSDSTMDAVPVDSEAMEAAADLDELPDRGFKISVNCLYVQEMKSQEFMDGFIDQLKELFLCGDHLYIDVTCYERMENEIVECLITANLEAKRKKKNLLLRMLEQQKEVLYTFLPSVEIIDKVEDNRPRFDIIGSCMNLVNVDVGIFLREFPSHFQELLYSGYKSVVVDISQMEEFPNKAIDFTVLCYLDAMAEGIAMTLRIRPDMEENFIKSGRGKTIPLELVTFSTEPSYQGKSKFQGVDMSKIQDAIEGDKLTQKVLGKQFEALHVESRGSIQNWEPSPSVATDRKSDYKGTERRRERRYQGNDLEVAFGRGSLAKISGRRYPVINISIAGACFISGTQLSRSESIRIKVFHEDVEIEIGAKVIWSSPIPSRALFEVGVEYTKLSVLAKSKVQDLTRKLFRNQRG